MKRGLIEYGISALLALALTVLIILLMPVLTTGYLLRQTGSEITNPIDFMRFEDLDGDGESEVIRIYLNSADNISVSVTTLHESTINQFNLRGELLTLGPELDLWDMNMDGTKDIMVCTRENDSIFLAIIDDLYSKPTRHHEFFIDQAGQWNDQGDYLFNPGGCSDLNGDGYQEYIFSISGGYSLQPRAVYAADLWNDTVYRSPISAAGILQLRLFDIDADSADEILLKIVAPYNFKEPFPFADSVSWLMVLDQDLHFYRSPRIMHPAPSWVDMEPFVSEGEVYILALSRNHSSTGRNSQLSLMNHRLDVLQTRRWSGSENLPNGLWKVPGSSRMEDVKVLIDHGIYALNLDLEFTDSVFNDVSFGDDYLLEVLDLDKNGEDEYVVFEGSQLVVFSSDYRQLASIPVQWIRERSRILVSLRSAPDSYPQLAVQAGSRVIYYEFGKNLVHVYRFLIYPGIFLVLFGVLYVMVVVQTRLISRRYEKDRLIGQLQLQSIKNQLDPHFTYNALNAVGSLIYKGEKDLAYRYLKGLTDLLRMVSGDPAQVTWTLSDELEFVLKYLEIEKLRFREKFTYRIKVESGTVNGSSLQEKLVPKMSVLTFVENAIKHGLRHKERDRRLDIHAYRTSTGIRINIRDNGIGRAAAACLSHEQSGTGMEIMDHYFRQFNEAGEGRARFEIQDLFEENQGAAGTLVEITID